MNDVRLKGMFDKHFRFISRLLIHYVVTRYVQCDVNLCTFYQIIQYTLKINVGILAIKPGCLKTGQHTFVDSHQRIILHSTTNKYQLRPLEFM